MRFCEDRWLGNTTLQEQYPALYNIIRNKSDTIATVMQSSPPNAIIGPRLVTCCSPWDAGIGPVVTRVLQILLEST